MIVTSNWKLTLGTGTELLGYGQEMPEELKFSQRNGLEVVAAPDSAWPLLLDTGNSAVTLKFGVLRPFSTDKEARANLLDGLILRAAETITTLKVEVSGYPDRHWIFAQCRAAEFEPVMHVTARGAYLLRGFALTCAGLSYVP